MSTHKNYKKPSARKQNKLKTKVKNPKVNRKAKVSKGFTPKIKKDKPGIHGRRGFNI